MCKTNRVLHTLCLLFSPDISQTFSFHLYPYLQADENEACLVLQKPRCLTFPLIDVEVVSSFPLCKQRKAKTKDTASKHIWLKRLSSDSSFVTSHDTHSLNQSSHPCKTGIKKLMSRSGLGNYSNSHRERKPGVASHRLSVLLNHCSLYICPSSHLCLVYSPVLSSCLSWRFRSFFFSFKICVQVSLLSPNTTVSPVISCCHFPIGQF